MGYDNPPPERVVVVAIRGRKPVDAVVLSPHPDDAVFSAWDALRSHPRPLVITVFAGVPEPGFVTALDRDHGATESAAWADRRRAEDQEAVASAGCEVVHGDLLDLQYRIRSVPGISEEVEHDPRCLLHVARQEPSLRVCPDAIGVEVNALIGADTVVYASAGVGGHPDHEDVARYAVSLVPRVREVRLFADSPYYLRHGLPSWVTSEPNDDSDQAIARAFHGLRLEPARLVRRSVRLTGSDIVAKMDAMRMYQTEFDPVDADFHGVASDSGLMRHETYWVVR
jgi:LmbE family N-acetylglucosaminyl deacetylase